MNYHLLPFVHLTLIIPSRPQLNNLHLGLDEGDVTEAFGPFGPLELVQVARDPATGKQLGFGFVQYREFGDGVKVRKAAG